MVRQDVLVNSQKQDGCGSVSCEHIEGPECYGDAGLLDA